MIEIILPGFGINDKLNQLFIQEYKNHSDYQRFDKVFFGVRGNFPQAYWNGELNNTLELKVYNDIQSIIQDYENLSISCWLDCSSIYFNNPPYYDAISKTILTLLNLSGNSKVIIGNYEAYNYLSSLYPYCFYIKNNFYTGENLPIKQILFPYQLKDCNFNKKDIYLRIDNNCEQCTKEKYLECLTIENNNIINFTDESIFSNCEKYCEGLILKCSSINNTIDDYFHKGYNKFILPDYSYHNYELQLSYYIMTLIKPEYQLEFFNYIMFLYNK